jgi:xylulose-5-phosphate/fructose-6-phosphate phosphoketolase
VAAAAAWEFMNSSKNVVNLVTFNKIPQPRWIDINHARFQYDNGGASIFGFASDDNPDVIVAACGDIPTFEALECIKLAKQRRPDLRVRFIGITALSYAAIGTTENKLSQELFDEYYTTDKPIIANFHGYPETLRVIFSHYTDTCRTIVHGYQDEGSTTSPLDELGRNGVSRYNIAASILDSVGARQFHDEFARALADNAEYASIYCVDR